MSKGQNCSFKFDVNTDKPMQKKDMIFQQTQRRAQYGQKISNTVFLRFQNQHIFLRITFLDRMDGE